MPSRPPTAALLALLLASALPAAEPSPTAFLPPPPPWSGASRALIAKPDNPWITPCEQSGLLDSPNYDDTIAWLRRLADASPLIDLQEFGRTAAGRPLYAVIASRQSSVFGGAESSKPVVLAQAGIHSGEIDGKDAGMMLLRDIAFGGKDDLLDTVDFVLVPVLNADGHERRSPWNRPNQNGPIHQGWRTTAQNLNLNRDYTKADAPEMQALLALIAKWQPSLYLDLHVTDGIDYQYDITFGYHGDDHTDAWSPQIGAWLNGTFRPAVTAALRNAGHIPGPLVFAVNDRDLTKGLSTGASNPRFSNSYGDLRHIPSILIENHSLKPYPQRVLGTYVFLEAALRAVGDHAAELNRAVEADRLARPDPIPMNWEKDPARTAKTDFAGIAYEEYDSPVSGIKEVRWLGTPRLYPGIPLALSKPGVQLKRPQAYYVPATKPDVIDRLRRHGIRMQTFTSPRTVEVTMYRLVDPQPAARPFEGRHALKAAVRPERRTETFPAGSVRIPTDQPLGTLAVVLLEPESADSFLAWGFFPEILQRTEYIEGYVLAPLAAKMLADNPKLKAEFESKLAADAKFAADPAARLRWFYERTPFYDDRYLLYPVGLER